MKAGTKNTRGPATLLTLLLVALMGGCASLQADRREPKGDFYTTLYLSKREALRSVFPEAQRVVREDLVLSPNERKKAQELFGSLLRQRNFSVYFGVTEQGELDGYAVIQEEIGKFKLITFIVGVEPSGAVRRVAVMVYREARGGEVAQRRFLVQYEGKTVKEPFSMNRDIINITGATMSVNSMNRGVKKVLAVIETLYRRHPERTGRVLGIGEEEPEFSPKRSSHSTSRPIHSRQARLVMGSLCEIEVWGRDPGDLSVACERAFFEIERIDSALSDYRQDSELSRISTTAREWVPISDLTAEFLKSAEEISTDSSGAFDLTVGALVDAWGFGSKSPRAPSEQELHTLRHLVDYRKVELRQQRSGLWRARLAEKGMRLDPGGLGKGFAVDRAVAVLKRLGVERALVNFSGCMYALGTPPGEPGWRVAVRDPERPSQVLGTLFLRDDAVASSGGYEKNHEIDGVHLSHILSPQTLRPIEGVFGAVVRAPNATLADGWSTAATVLGKDAVRYLEKARGLEGIVALRSGQSSTSEWKVVPVYLE